MTFKEPFTKYNIEKKNDTFTIWLNEEERRQFEEAKNIIQQSKDSTAFKQLAFGSVTKLKGGDWTKYWLKVSLNNFRKNKRLGVVDFE